MSFLLTANGSKLKTYNPVPAPPLNINSGMQIYRYKNLIESNADLFYCQQWILQNIRDICVITPQIHQKIQKFLQSYTTISLTKFNKALRQCYQHNNILTKEYWIERGHPKETVKQKISNLQKSRSKCSVDYWIKQGIPVADAKKRVREYQQSASRKSASKKTLAYWLETGLSLNEARVQLDNWQNKCSPWKKEYWILKGLTPNEAENKIRKNAAKASSAEKQIEKYGINIGHNKWKESCCLRARSGSLNGMFGRPPPVGAGRGISGYYEGHYFRSLWEYAQIKKYIIDGILFVCNDVAETKHATDKIIIPYHYRGIHRNYIPDFLLPREKKIVEIKNRFTVLTEEWKQKEKALQAFLNISNKYSCYEVITSISLPSIESIREDYESRRLIIDAGKIDRFLKRFKLIDESHSQNISSI